MAGASDERGAGLATALDARQCGGVPLSVKSPSPLLIRCVQFSTASSDEESLSPRPLFLSPHGSPAAHHQGVLHKVHGAPPGSPLFLALATCASVSLLCRLGSLLCTDRLGANSAPTERPSAGRRSARELAPLLSFQACSCSTRVLLPPLLLNEVHCARERAAPGAGSGTALRGRFPGGKQVRVAGGSVRPRCLSPSPRRPPVLPAPTVPPSSLLQHAVRQAETEPPAEHFTPHVASASSLPAVPPRANPKRREGGASQI